MPPGRPKKISDEKIFAATQRAMARLGPDELTLADIADEAGVTASALAQRFGSKRSLLLAVMRAFSGSATPMFEALREEATSCVQVIYRYGECMARIAETPELLARNLAWLHLDLTDSDFRACLQTNARATRKELIQLINEAIDKRELTGSEDAALLASAIEAVISGTLMSWAVAGKGSARTIMKRNLNALMFPYFHNSSFRQRFRARSA